MFRPERNIIDDFGFSRSVMDDISDKASVDVIFRVTDITTELWCDIGAVLADTAMY